MLIYADAAIGFSQSSVETNGERILDLSLRELGKSLLIDTLSIPVYLTGNLSDQYRYEVTRFLLSEHKQILSQADNHADLRLQVTASNRYRKMDDGKARRIIKGSVMVTLTDTAGVIGGMEQHSFAATDTVPSGLRDELASSWPPARFEDAHRHRSWIVHRILEPGLFLAALGVTVYLLFNVRGN